jgi:hypothetical protein
MKATPVLARFGEVTHPAERPAFHPAAERIAGGRRNRPAFHLTADGAMNRQTERQAFHPTASLDADRRDERPAFQRPSGGRR